MEAFHLTGVSSIIHVATKVGYVGILGSFTEAHLMRVEIFLSRVYSGMLQYLLRKF